MQTKKELKTCEQKIVHKGCGGILGDDDVCGKCGIKPSPQNRTVGFFCPSHFIPLDDELYCVVCRESCGL